MSEQKWSSAAATGFSAFALVCFIIWLHLSGYVPKENVPVFFAILTAGAVAQVIAGVIELARGQTIRGNLLFTFGTMFMLGPALTFLLTTLGLAKSTPLLGYCNILLGVFMGIYIIPLCKAPIMVFFVGPLGLFALSSLGFVEIGYHSVLPFARSLFAIAVVWGCYMMAHELGEAAGIHLPVGRALVRAKPGAQAAAEKAAAH